MSLFEFIRMMDDKDLAAFLTMFMMCAVKAVGIETGGLEIDLERETILEMLRAPLSEEMKDAIEMCKETNNLLS